MGVATKSSTSQNPIYCGEAPDAGVAVGTINELADALASRRISASTLLEQIIKRIEALDTRLNAVVVRDFERAREAAHAADIALSQGERRPLLGIPFTVKEAINVAGLPTTWGFPEFKDFIPKEDALITSRAKRAGAVLLGKTNVPLGLGDFQSHNDIYGTTNNPWDVSRSPGGSSGGSAAAIAAGFGSLSLDDIFDLQDQVTASVVGAIEPRLQQAEIERAGRKPTESLDAYDYFLRGMASFHLFTRDSLLEARRLFQRATELDANYASAYGIAAWCVCLSKSNGWLFDPEREIAEGVRLARRAVAVGKDDPTALWSGGINLAYLAAVLETAAAYIDRAIVLNPNLAAAWSAGGWLRIYLGEPVSAIERLERSMRLSPLDPIAYMGYAGMALALLLADRYGEAASWAAKAINEQPNWAMPLRVAAIAYALSDRIVEAREAMARLREFDPTLRLSNLERVAPPFRRPEDRARYADGLRRAGLPE